MATKHFFAGLFVGCVLFSGVAYYIYATNKNSYDTLNAETIGLRQQKKVNTTANINSFDANTLSAKLLNRQLEELSEKKGADFDSHYIMLLASMTNNLATLSDSVRKLSADSTVKAVADKEYADANTKMSELLPLRVKFGLIHDD